MQFYKRPLSLLLALCLLFSALPGSALAVDAADGADSAAQTVVENPADSAASDTAQIDAPASTDAAQDNPSEEASADPAPETMAQTPIAGNVPSTDEEIQAALETYDPTIDDPEYLKAYNRHQAFLQEEDSPTTYAANPYTGTNYTHTKKTKYTYYGIDVSQWQGTINWKKVKAAGITFAFVRSSYTSLSSFSLHTDGTFATNVKNAAAAGVKVGVYHYSGATSATEAKKEAEYVLKLIAPYKSKISLPVVIDYETNGSDRIYTTYKKTSKAKRTTFMTTFCDTVQAAGYTGGIYCSTSWYSTFFNPAQLEKYSCWVAQWASKNTYTYDYDFWQYSDKGKISGITGAVDSNFWYTNTGVVSPSTEPTAEPASTALTTPYITKSSVNYRTGAGTSATKVGTFSKGTVIDVVYGWYKTVDGDKWYKFNYNGHAYYIHGDYIQREVLQAHTATASLNYRSTPSTSAASQGSFASGDAVQVVQDSAQTADSMTWYQVKVGNSYYYAAAQYLEPAETLVPHTAKSTVNVRAKAGTDQTKVTSLYATTPVSVVDGNSTTVSGERWEQVKIGSNYYYMMASYLNQVGGQTKPETPAEPETPVTPEQPAATPTLTTTYVTTSVLHYRTGCGTNYASKGTVAKGKPVNVVYGWYKSVNGVKWYKVKIGSSYYYMQGSYLKYEARVKYTTTSKLNYRTGAGTSYTVKGSFAKGASVQVVKGWSKKVSGSTWYKVRVGNSYYYVMAKYLKKAETVVLYNTKSKVNVRSKAGLDQTLVATLSKGTPVAAIAGGTKTISGKKWYKVKVDTKYYYMMASYLTKA